MLKPGDLIFVRGHLTSLVDDAIKLGEYIEDHTPPYSNYTHVALFVTDNVIAESQAGRRAGYAPLARYRGDFDVGHVDLTDDERKQVIKAAQAQFYARYDWKMILYIILGVLFGVWKPYKEKSRRICSTFVADAFGAAGVRLVDNDHPTPEDLALSPKVTIEKVIECR